VEITTFRHQCGDCDHIIGEHFHRFQVNSGVQEYYMECILCGKVCLT
jgi:hypothetical protein